MKRFKLYSVLLFKPFEQAMSLFKEMFNISRVRLSKLYVLICYIVQHITCEVI